MWFCIKAASAANDIKDKEDVCKLALNRVFTNIIWRFCSHIASWGRGMNVGKHIHLISPIWHFHSICIKWPSMCVSPPALIKMMFWIESFHSTQLTDKRVKTPSPIEPPSNGDHTGQKQENNQLDAQCWHKAHSNSRWHD